MDTDVINYYWCIFNIKDYSMISIFKSIWSRFKYWQKLLSFCIISIQVFAVLQIAKFVQIIDSYEALALTFVWLIVHCTLLALFTYIDIRNNNRLLDKRLKDMKNGKFV